MEKTDLFVGKTKFPISMDLFAKRPNSTAVRVMGATVQSKRGLLLPSPSVFLKSGDYDLSMGAPRTVAGVQRYVVLASPRQKGPGMFSWRLEVASDPWVVVVSEARDSEGESGRIETEYKHVADVCWLPVKFEGRGKLLLRSALPSGFLTWVFNVFTGDEEVRNGLTLSNLKINVGLPDSMFK